MVRHYTSNVCVSAIGSPSVDSHSWRLLDNVVKTSVGTAECPLERCDYNGDTTVSASDALAILRAAVGVVAEPKCPAALANDVAATDEVSTTTTIATSTTTSLQEQP